MYQRARKCSNNDRKCQKKKKDISAKPKRGFPLASTDYSLVTKTGNQRWIGKWIHRWRDGGQVIENLMTNGISAVSMDSPRNTSESQRGTLQWRSLETSPQPSDSSEQHEERIRGQHFPPTGYKRRTQHPFCDTPTKNTLTDSNHEDQRTLH